MRASARSTRTAHARSCGSRGARRFRVLEPSWSTQTRSTGVTSRPSRSTRTTPTPGITRPSRGTTACEPARAVDVVAPRPSHRPDASPDTRVPRPALQWMRTVRQRARLGRQRELRIDPTHILVRQGLGHGRAVSAMTSRGRRISARRSASGKGATRFPDGSACRRSRSRRGIDLLRIRCSPARSRSSTRCTRRCTRRRSRWGYAAFGDTTRALRILERYDPTADSHYQLHLQRDPVSIRYALLPRSRRSWFGRPDTQP